MNKMHVPLLIFAVVSIGMPTAHADDIHLPKLKVSPNKRFLVTESGKPFFWLGDTAWELFHRSNRAQADHYLQTRAAQGFTVVQAVAIAEFDGHTVPNAYGHLPLVDLDPARPAVKDGPDNDYWDHVDYVVDKANSLGLYIGFLPTWGRYWHDKVKDGKPLFTVENAEKYGLWLGRRYRDKGLVWILGGDRSVDNEQQKEVIRAMARGLRQGDGGAHLITFHPPGGAGSAQWFHADNWLDFNMRQNGHNADYTGRYSKTHDDYLREPTKPVLDGEPLYEDHPLSFAAKKFGHSIAADVRRPLYWDLFSGAFGHTYGHHSVWQMWEPTKTPINDPLLPWEQALNQPGAKQMQFGRRLMESRPFLTRIPDDDIIVTDRVPTAVPGAGRYRFTATRDASGSYAMVYAPIGRPFRVRMDKITGPSVKAWWFNPRTGEATSLGAFPNTGACEFMTPTPGELLDWVLVLDDASKNYPLPGSAGKRHESARGGNLPGDWNPKLAAHYLDERAQIWFAFAGADRGEGPSRISCISCHTLAPFALARPVLRKLSGVADATSFETKLLTQTRERVAHWSELDSDKYRLFYDFSDQKKKESWGTEAVMNAMVLAFDDHYQGRRSAEPGTKAALANLWRVQQATGTDKGSWDWLNFGLEPWETTSSRYFGAALAALAVGTAPDYYKPGGDTELDGKVTLLRTYLRDQLPSQNLNNRIWLLWASTKLTEVLTAEQRQGIIDAALDRQQKDGGWSLSSLGTKSPDGFVPDAQSDGYATGLVLHVLQEAGMKKTESHIANGLNWLRSNQAPNGAWLTKSVNRKRDPNSHVGKFMSDAATAYAVLALSH